MATYWVKELAAYSMWLLSSLKCAPHLLVDISPGAAQGWRNPAVRKSVETKEEGDSGFSGRKTAAPGLKEEWKYRDMAREMRSEKKESLENRYAEQGKYDEKEMDY